MLSYFIKRGLDFGTNNNKANNVMTKKKRKTTEGETVYKPQLLHIKHETE